jgi:hypothetical protein
MVIKSTSLHRNWVGFRVAHSFDTDLVVEACLEGWVARLRQRQKSAALAGHYPGLRRRLRHGEKSPTLTLPGAPAPPDKGFCASLASAMPVW